MARLTDPQLVILLKASQRKDRAATPPHNLRGVALKREIAALIKQRYLIEAKAPRGTPTWRLDEAKERMALLITKRGTDALGAVSREVKQPAAAADRKLLQAALTRRQQAGRGHKALAAPDRTRGQGRVVSGPHPMAGPAARRKAAKGGGIRPIIKPAAGSKLLLVLTLIARAGGATLGHLSSETGWLPHTTRAAVTCLRKRGYRIEAQRDAKGRSPIGWSPNSGDPKVIRLCSAGSSATAQDYCAVSSAYTRTTDFTSAAYGAMVLECNKYCASVQESRGQVMQEQEWRLRQETEAAKLILAGIRAEFGDDDAEFLEHAIEGETDLLEAIDTAIAEIDESEVLISGLKEKEGQFFARRRAMEERVKRFRGLVEQAMAVAEQQKLRRPAATLTLKKLPPDVVVLSEAEIPAEFFVPQPPPPPKLDKRALREALQTREIKLAFAESLDEGEERQRSLAAIPSIPGAALGNGGFSLQIRRA